MTRHPPPGKPTQSVVPRATGCYAHATNMLPQLPAKCKWCLLPHDVNLISGDIRWCCMCTPKFVEAHGNTQNYMVNRPSLDESDQLRACEERMNRSVRCPWAVAASPCCCIARGVTCPARVLRISLEDVEQFLKRYNERLQKHGCSSQRMGRRRRYPVARCSAAHESWSLWQRPDTSWSEFPDTLRNRFPPAERVKVCTVLHRMDAPPLTTHPARPTQRIHNALQLFLGPLLGKRTEGFVCLAITAEEVEAATPPMRWPWPLQLDCPTKREEPPPLIGAALEQPPPQGRLPHLPRPCHPLAPGLPNVECAPATRKLMAGERDLPNTGLPAVPASNPDMTCFHASVSLASAEPYQLFQITMDVNNVLTAALVDTATSDTLVLPALVAIDGCNSPPRTVPLSSMEEEVVPRQPWLEQQEVVIKVAASHIYFGTRERRTVYAVGNAVLEVKSAVSLPDLVHNVSQEYCEAVQRVTSKCQEVFAFYDLLHSKTTTEHLIPTGDEEPVYVGPRGYGFEEQQFGETERCYHSNEHKCLVMVWMLRKYQPHLESMQRCHGKLAHWKLLLQLFDFMIEHVAGRHNELPDLLLHDLEDAELLLDNADLDILFPSERLRAAEDAEHLDHLSQAVHVTRLTATSTV
ncbi:hypothetical protein PR048_011379 [Dryococelus australis]|uniref:Uncharacterized protein n=1 Tax=Dryococelus australis TaxID=614101 RepID=A0ABQ9HLF4_9NEOP|nr:hypothetical protein PR048_011379 [Dryococelus australis]